MDSYPERGVEDKMQVREELPYNNIFTKRIIAKNVVEESKIY